MRAIPIIVCALVIAMFVANTLYFANRIRSGVDPPQVNQTRLVAIVVGFALFCYGLYLYCTR